MLKTSRARTLLVAWLALALGFALEAVVLRRYGIGDVPLVPDERPPPAPEPPPLAPALVPPAPLARSLYLFLLDGLRVDSAEGSPAWRRLAPGGARLRARLRFAVYSAPGRSLLVTGAPPEVTGVFANERTTDGTVDHLFARAAKDGIAVSPDAWPEKLGLAPFVRFEKGREHPRTFEVQDWIEPDHAGHEHGADSEEYRRATELVSARLLEAVAAIDLTKDAVLAVSDHGHVATGGHVGTEPDVVTAPALFLGAGVKPGFARDEPVAMEDVGATAALLLGLEPPRLSRGVPVVDALELAADRGARVVEAAKERRAELALAWDQAVHPARVLLVRALAALVLVLGAAWLARPKLDRTLGAALVGPLVFFPLWATLAPPLSANGGVAWCVPFYLGFFFAGMLLAALLAWRLGCERESFERSALFAWVLTTALGLARFGLEPGGLAPEPLVFALCLSAGNLGSCAVLVLVEQLVAVVRSRSRSKIAGL